MPPPPIINRCLWHMRFSTVLGLCHCQHGWRPMRQTYNKGGFGMWQRRDSAGRRNTISMFTYKKEKGKKNLIRNLVYCVYCLYCILRLYSRKRGRRAESLWAGWEECLPAGPVWLFSGSPPLLRVETLWRLAFTSHRRVFNEVTHRWAECVGGPEETP